MGLGLLEITSEPYCGSGSEAQLAEYLVFGYQDFTNSDRIVVSFLELSIALFFENL
jgi:hypothetical protein